MDKSANLNFFREKRISFSQPGIVSLVMLTKYVFRQYFGQIVPAGLRRELSRTLEAFAGGEVIVHGRETDVTNHIDEHKKLTMTLTKTKLNCVMRELVRRGGIGEDY